jgi:pimeloyl-ACP methyl ester carboxylesterase
MIRSLARLCPLGAVLALATAAPAQTPSFQATPCPRGLAGARCGTVQVPENREAPGRMLALKVVVFPARSATPAKEAITFFGGGPGQAIAADAQWVAPLFAAAMDERDLLFIDQRGTGGSAALECVLRDTANPQSYMDDFLPAGPAARCRDELARRADLTRYGYIEHAHDVEAVRHALGYERLDLNGGSYGTRAALVYLRTYPQNVRSAVLTGLVPPGYLQPGDYARDLDAALAGLFAECRAGAACAAAFPDVEREARAVAERLEASPGVAEIIHPQSGARIRVAVSRGTYVETIRRMMYNAGPARSVPYVIHRAHLGDYRPLARAAFRDRRAMEKGGGWGLYLAITCTEDVPFIDQAAAAAQNGRTLLGDYRIRQQADACRGWPTDSLPADYHQPFRSDVPMLLISGMLDPVTPPRWGERVAASFPNGLHVVVPHAGHGYGGLQGLECVDSLVNEFYRQGSARGLDPSPCLRRLRPPPFVTEMPEPIALEPAALRRLAGVYASTQPAAEMRVEALDGVLRFSVGQEFIVIASPLSATEFNWEGMPREFSFTFSDDGRTLTMREPGSPPIILTRKP